MTTGGNLLVSSAADYLKNFKVKVPQNLEITNYRQREMGEIGDIKTVVANGQDGLTSRIATDKSKLTNRASLDLREPRYTIFDKLRKLDGNADDFTEQDLAHANSLVGELGVVGIKRDANAGVTTIMCEDGAVLRFDFETAAEKKTRETNEAKKQEAANNQAQKTEAATKEACKSDVDKLVDWFLGLFQ